MAEHSPTPWCYKDNYDTDADGSVKVPVIVDRDYGCVAENEMGWDAQTETDFRHAVHCVNLHDELVAQLEDCKRFIPEHPADTVVGGAEKLSEIDALLAKAKGGA